MSRKRYRPPAVPADPWGAFAWFLNQCASGFARELMAQGKTETHARNAIIRCLVSAAAGEACRIARSEGREPNPTKWRQFTCTQFERAVKRTAPKKEGEAV